MSLITLPSGMSGEIRGFKGKEAHALADPALRRTNGSIDVMLKSCFVAVVDPGPYPHVKVGEPVDWQRILLGDRFDALMRIRGLSWGPLYEFGVQCGKCKEKYEWELSLDDMPRKPLPEETRAKIRAGDTLFDIALGDGKTLSFELAYGLHEQRANKKRHEQRNQWSLVDAILNQTKRISDIPFPEASKAQRAYLDELSWQDLREAFDDMQLVDCGVETDIETECPYCRWVQGVRFPFEEGFFLPRRKRTTTEATPKTPATTSTPTATKPTNEPSGSPSPATNEPG